VRTKGSTLTTAESTTVLVCGLTCVVAAIVGGGVKAAGWQFPIVNSVRRQMILGIFGLILIGISVFGRPHPDLTPGAGSDSTKESPPAPKSSVNQFRDDLFVIIDDAQNGFKSITDSDGHRLVPPLPGALRGQLHKELTGITADGSLAVEFACYDYDLDGKQWDTFDGLVDKVKHAIGDSWSENSFVEHQNNPAPQQRVWFTSPGQRSEVDVFEGYTYAPSTKQ
jgi:hypothetical protein